MTEDEVERIVEAVREVILSNCPVISVSPGEYVEVLEAVINDCRDSITAAKTE